VVNYSLSFLSRQTRWVRELTRPVPEPPWATPNEICLSLPLARLRRFDRDRKGVAPWILVSPNAGHHSAIADYAPKQSLAAAFLEHGVGPVFAIEWLSATPQTKRAGIDDYLLCLGELVDYAREAAGTEGVRLAGMCQGGWLSAMFAALFPERVENLVLAGAPIDFKAGNGKITKAVERLGLGWYENLVRRSGGVMPGSYMVAGWKLLNPLERFMEDPFKLWQNIQDERYVDRHRRFRNWYEWTQDLPGRFYLQVVRELFHGNRLVRREFTALGRKVDLSQIRCPVSTIGGFNDDITLREQLESVAEHVSSRNIRHRMVEAGHIGLFMARKVVEEVWPSIIREAHADAQPAAA
jgi:poly(3-hydroxybutyrate) depolymerase